MLMRPALAAFAASAALAWQAGLPAGTGPRPKPSDYPAHTALGEVALAAEYTVRSVGSDRDMFIVPGYLVFEVAFYPPSGGAVEVASSVLRLRVNGKKQLLAPDSPGTVAAALKYSDWEMHPNLEVGGGAGNAQVILGRRRPERRFPGDRRGDRDRVPMPQASEPPAGDAVTPVEAVVEWALPDGKWRAAVSGYVYFPFRGKPKSIKSLELIHGAGAQAVTLKLF